jgi:DNA gyrase subunit B
MAKQFKDDEYTVITTDVKKIMTRPTLFVSSLGDAGVLHLCKELIDNASDEAMKKESPCDSFTIEVSDKAIRVYDNGRGMPTDIMQTVYETMQAGTNMTRSNGATRGENSLGGSTCLVALSSYFKSISTRPQEKKRLTLVYKNGILDERILEDYNGNDHGLDVTFMPSKKIMGTDKIPIDDLVNWLKEFDYTIGNHTNVRYIIKGKEYKVHHKNLKDFFDIDISDDKRFSKILTGCVSGKIDEIYMEKATHRMYKVEYAIMYANASEDIRQSWMNMIHTTQNGSHMDGVIKGFTKFITEECVRKNKKLADEDIRRDVLAHLQVVIKAECDMAHMFASQAKHTVLQKDLGKAIENSVYNELKENGHSAIPSIIDAIIGNHRARIEGEKARNVASVTRVKKQWTTPDTFIPCSSVKTDMPKELFIVEGKSAGGGLTGGRDARYQAILMNKGKSLNVYDVDVNRAVTSDSWMNYVPILGCGIGPTFDMKKLKFDKIIITTDADIDGFQIRTLILTFFFRFLPQLIEAGKIYIAEPPLYKLVNGKDVSYVATQTEYIEKCIKSVGDLRLEFPDRKDANATVQAFIREAFDYNNILRECSIDRSVNRYLLEHIAFGLSKYGSVDGFIKNIDKWIRSLVKIYPELGFNHDTNQIVATIDLVDQLVVVDEELYQTLYPIIDIINRYGLLIHYTSEKRSIDRQTVLSKFFEYVEDLYPVIKGRYKGLGSSDAIVMREVVMDPRTRRIIRVTANDVLTMQKMGALVGNGKDNITQRKEMLLNFKFTKADIDN